MPIYLLKFAKKGRHLWRNFKIALHSPSSLNPLIPEPLLPSTSRHFPSAFTLVELMAVVGIMGLLAAVAVPALKGLTGSGGRKMALNQVLSALEIARNNAISSGANAAVIFPNSSFKEGEAYKYRSMAVINWNPTNASNNTMSGSWITLPQGISFVPNSIANLSTLTNISVRILTKTTNLSSVQGIVFQSDGALAENYYKTTLTSQGVSYFEGTVSGTSPTSSITNKVETVRLTRYTGRATATLDTAP